MSFYYDPLTPEQAEKERQFPMLEPGTYDFEVVKAEFKMSNTGPYAKPGNPSNPMIALQLLMWDESGKEFFVFDNLMGTPKMAWKTIRFCNTVGLSKEYEAGKFNEHLCEGKTGKAVVVIQPGKAKEGGGFFKDKNAVDDYVVEGNVKVELSGNKSPEPKVESSPLVDDDLPF